MCWRSGGILRWLNPSQIVTVNFFYDFFNSPLFIVKLYERGLYGIGTAWKHAGDACWQKDEERWFWALSGKVVSCTWLGRHLVTMMLSNVERMATTSTITHRKKGSTSKSQVPCPNVIKINSKGMRGVNLVHQSTEAYYLDQKSTNKFYLHVIFELMDVTYDNSYIVYNMMHLNYITLLDFKTFVLTYLTERYASRWRASTNGKTGFKRRYQYQFEDLIWDLFGDAVNIDAKKELTQKLTLNAKYAEFSYVWPLREIVWKNVVLKERYNIF